MLTPREKQALAVIAGYIEKNYYYVQWSIAIDYSGIEFNWSEHPRLIRAQSFSDPDYPTAIIRALQDIYSKDKNALRSVLAYIFSGKVPDEINVIQAFQNLGLVEGEQRDILVSVESPIVSGLKRTIEINPIFTRRALKIEDDLVFMLMPFRPNFERIYEEHIKTTLNELHLRSMKADDIFSTGPIIEDVWEYINKARIIVSDVTGRNPNVFYELGIAHTIGKDVIIIAQNEDDIPFDLRHLRYFTYSDDEKGWEELKSKLRKVIHAILSK